MFALLRDRFPLARQMISSLVSIQLAYINTAHPDFLGGRHALARVVSSMKQKTVGQLADESELQEPLALTTEPFEKTPSLFESLFSSLFFPSRPRFHPMRALAVAPCVPKLEDLQVDLVRMLIVFLDFIFIYKDGSSCRRIAHCVVSYHCQKDDPG